MKGMTQKVLATALITILPVAAASAAEDEWEFTLAPLYLWGKSIQGAAGLGPTDAPLDLDFRDDVLENLDAAFAAHFEAKYNDLTLFAEYNFARLDPTVEESLGPITARADVEFEDTMWELGVTYSFYNSDRTNWEFLFGLRHLDQKIDADLAVVTPGPGEGPGVLPDSISGGDDWYHGFGGFRVTTKLSEKWSLRARADLGYRSGTNKATHLMANFDYRFTDWGSFFVGYRFLDLEYDNGAKDITRYAFDGDQQGPLVGVAFYW